jgi:uncharacterized membrane protein
MTSLIVASFPNEAQAIAASHKLVELESHGAITVYEKAILKKDTNGETAALQTDTSDGLRTIAGLALGGFVGVLAGPVGLVVGMISGTATGALLESRYINFSDDFISKVDKQLQPGTVAIVGEIYESNPAIVDNALESLGAITIFRSDVDHMYDKYLDERIDKVEKKIDMQRARIKSAAAGERSKIHEKIAQLKEKRRQGIVELNGKHKAGITKMKTSMKEEKKSRLKNRIYKHQTRITELEEKLRKIEH